MRGVSAQHHVAGRGSGRPEAGSRKPETYRWTSLQHAFAFQPQTLLLALSLCCYTQLYAKSRVRVGAL